MTNLQTMSEIPFEIVKVENKKAPLFLEIPVPPYCTPILVCGSTLKWVEKASKKQTVITCFLTGSVKDVSDKCIEAIKEKAKSESWNSFFNSEDGAIKKVQLEGVGKTKRLGNLIVPQEHDLLGTLIVFEDKIYPVIHNSIRAICFIED